MKIKKKCERASKNCKIKIDTCDYVSQKPVLPKKKKLQVKKSASEREKERIKKNIKQRPLVWGVTYRISLKKNFLFNKNKNA